MNMPWQARADRRRLSSAYQTTFKGAEAELVLADLAIYCRATSSVFGDGAQTDALALAREEGKREVWLRLQDFLSLSYQEQTLALRQHYQEILAERGRVVDQARVEG